MVGRTLLALTLVVGTALAVESVPPGTPIVAIVVVRHEVFDTKAPGSSAWPYRAANFLHLLTQERFIRSQLVFAVGDPLAYELLAESERNLRTHGFLNPVRIFARPALGGCEVVVETFDQWTTQVGLNYGAFGRRRHAGFALSEDNLLGWGKQLLLDVEREEERNTVTFRYRDPLFLGHRLRLELGHSNASDGSVDGIALEAPFFSLATSRAARFEWERVRRTEWLYAFGKKAVSGRVNTRQGMLWGGFRLPGDGPVQRVRLGAFYEKASYKQWAWRDGQAFAPPENRTLAGVLVGFERQPPRWAVTTGFRGWQRQEDVPVGTRWNATVGWSLPQLGADRMRLLVSADIAYAVQANRWYAWLLAAAAGRLERRSWKNGVLRLEAAAVRTGEKGWRARVAGEWGHALDRDRQLALGADTGLRGWDPDFFDGTSRFVANLEWRQRLTDEILHLGILGFSVFADVGKTSGARIGRSTEGWHANVGAGLLVELTRASIVRTLRLELALPDDGHGPTFLATSSVLF